MSTKIDATERLLNLVIALLGTSRGHSKNYIRSHINGYDGVAFGARGDDKAVAAFERKFERDKATLLELGIPVSHKMVSDLDAGDQFLYFIDPEDYRVPQIRLDEQAMTLLSVAAGLWEEASLGSAAQSALRKIASRTGTAWYEDDATTQSRIRTAEPSFQPLWDALRGHHLASFSYRKSQSGPTTSRHVQPWGLGSKYGQWYLAAFDVDKGESRNFRLSRIVSEVTVDTTKTFVRPDAFSIYSVLEGLGKGQPFTCEIALPVGTARYLRGRSGAATVPQASWRREGWDVIRLPYRESELMADDVAALGADAQVLTPPELRQAVAARLQKSAAVSGESTEAWGPEFSARPVRRKDARDRLIRLLSMVPYLVANPGVEESAMLTEFGISAAQWAKDMDTLNVTGLPGYYHGDLMDVTAEAGQVFIRDAETLSSPLRLTQEEACSVLAGLHALADLPGMADSPALAQAVEALTEAAGDDAWLAGAVGLHLVPLQDAGTIARLEQAVQQRRACAIKYLVRSRDEVSERIVEPLRLFSIDSAWYLRAWCRKAGELRSFRVDHIQEMVDAGARQHDPGATAARDVGNGVYDPGSNDVAVQLLAEPLTALRLAPAYNASLHETAGERLGLRLLVGDPATLAPLMARLGGRASVVAPEDVRRQTQDWLVHASDSYDADGETSGEIPGTGR